LSGFDRKDAEGNELISGPDPIAREGDDVVVARVLGPAVLPIRAFRFHAFQVLFRDRDVDVLLTR
jgi:hypothetical protein